MQHKILVTGAGGGGGENLIASLRMSSLDLHICGSNMDEHYLARSAADEKIWLPSGLSDEYTDALEHVVRTKGIELVVPNNDTEVGRISRDRDKLSCKVFLPPADTVGICQDKLEMHRRFSEAGIPQAAYGSLASLDDVDAFMDANPFEKYWVRLRRCSGSMGATWVENAEQGRAWIKLWMELRGMQISDFIVSEFLPGKDYAFQSVWKNGEVVVAKMVQRLQYVAARNRLSNMSSSPTIARTVRDEGALDTIFRAVRAVSKVPHGNYCLDLKGRTNGEMCITEFNIGRFCMITPVFDRTGKHNTADIHVKCALGYKPGVEDPIDIEDDCYIVRALDTLPSILRGDEFREIMRAAKEPLEGFKAAQG